MLEAAGAFPQLLTIDWEDTLEGVDIDDVNATFHLTVEGPVLTIHRRALIWLTITPDGSGMVKVAKGEGPCFTTTVEDGVNFVVNLILVDQAVRLRPPDGWPCECSCGCRKKVYHDTAYCSACSNGCCGEY